MRLPKPPITPESTAGIPPYNGGYPNNGYNGGGDGGFYGNNGNTQGQ